MGTASKPQSPSLSPPMAELAADHPPVAVATTAAELEAAIAALPTKKAALREAFDRLAACSPFPLPFAWEDLDAHISSLQASISLRFRQLRVLEAARPAPAASKPGETLDGGNAKNQGEDDEEDPSEGEEWEEVEEEEEVEEVEEEEEEEEEEADGEMDKKSKEGVKEDIKDEKEASGEEEEVEEEEVEEEEVGEEEVEEVEVDEDHEADDKIGNETKDAMEVAKEQACEGEEQGVDEEMQVADEEHITEDAKSSSQRNEDEAEGFAEQEASKKDQHTDMEEMVATKASTVGGKEDRSCEEERRDQQVQDPKKGNKVNLVLDEVVGWKAEEVCREPSNRTPPGAEEDLVQACATMNSRKLVLFVHKSVVPPQEFPIAMHHAPDAAALVLCVLKLFLQNQAAKSNKAWINCVELIQCVPAATAEPSPDTIEQAKRFAKDWKEMVDEPGSQGKLGSLASWCLLNFLISYNIVSEFDTNEIIRLFGTVPHNQQKQNTMELCKGLGLSDRITDLIDYLIGNGQDMDTIHLAHVFHLVDKYHPVSLLEGYLEKAKQTVMGIFGKNMARKSMNAVIAKEIKNLRVAQKVVKQHITDASRCNIIVAEIKNLLDMNRKKRKKQDYHPGQKRQHQGEEIKSGESPEQNQNKPQQIMQHQQQEEGTEQQEKQQQKQQQCTWNVAQTGHFTPPPGHFTPPPGHFTPPPYSSMPLVHGHPAQPGWPAFQAVMFAPEFGARQYIRPPFDPMYPHGQFYPW
ncbi:hypothetical protein ACP4OV_008751 [Aristida adscensionis]